MSERIRWEPDGSKGWEGYAGTSDERLFDVWYASSDFGGVSIGEWALSTQLPAPRSRKQPHGRDPDELKATAERWLSEFVVSLGAIFGEAAQPAERSGKRKLGDADILDAFRAVTNWSDTEVLHYESCDQCNPEAGLVCDAIAAELAAAYREAAAAKETGQ